jgi:hypothetical protein
VVASESSPPRAASITPVRNTTLSTTLSTHPPQQTEALRQHGEAAAPRLTSRRPSALDKLALRAGLLLITYGRRRYALSREELARHAENARIQRARELDWDRARSLLLPPR